MIRTSSLCFALVAALSVSACTSTSDVDGEATGQTERALQRNADGSATGNGTTCSWDGSATPSCASPATVVRPVNVPARAAGALYGATVTLAPSPTKPGPATTSPVGTYAARAAALATKYGFRAYNVVESTGQFSAWLSTTQQVAQLRCDPEVKQIEGNGLVASPSSPPAVATDAGTPGSPGAPPSIDADLGSPPISVGPYNVGSTFVSPDGCNTCTCTAQGIACTNRICAAKPGDPPAPTPATICQGSESCATGEHCSVQDGVCNGSGGGANPGGPSGPAVCSGTCVPNK